MGGKVQVTGENAEPLIQIVDVLIGAIGYVRNGYLNQPGASPAKVEMVKFLEGLSGTGFAFDTAGRGARPCLRAGDALASHGHLR